MEPDLSPYMAVFFIFYYEDQSIRKTKRKDLNQARKFSRIFRFTDGLAAINDGGEVEKVYREIRTLELKLKRENKSDAISSLLDLAINMVRRIFSLILHD